MAADDIWGAENGWLMVVVVVVVVLRRRRGEWMEGPEIKLTADPNRFQTHSTMSQ